MWLLDVLKRNSELEFMFDLDLIAETSQKVYMKKLAVETCANFLGRTISQSEFRIKDGKNMIKDELYYRLNVRPNKNMTASMFWQKVVHKMIYDNECLVIQADDGDLLIADSYERIQYAVYEDSFKNVLIGDYEFRRTFPASKVLFLEYNNTKLAPLIDQVFIDYGEMFASLVGGQKRKNQIRSTVSVDSNFASTKDATAKLQNFINKIFESFNKNDVAVVPQQKGLEYKEHSENQTGSGNSVDEINKLTDGFMDKVAMALGIPLGLLHGEMADVEKQTKNYMTFTVSSWIKKINDEGNAKFFTMKDYLAGKKLEVRKVFYKDVFDLANSIDKIRSSSVMNGHELRDELGLDKSDDPIHDKYIMTKNYGTTDDSGEGGENE